MALKKPPDLEGWQIHNMHERHHQMARLLFLGYTDKQVADAIGCSASRVSAVKSSPVFQEKLAALQARADDRTLDVNTEIMKDAHKSFGVLRKVRDGELSQDVDLRVKVAQDLLDRAGHSRIQKVEGRHAIAHLDSEALDRIKSKAQMIREARSGEVGGGGGEAEEIGGEAEAAS